MSLADLSDPAAVVRAIELYDELGHDEFLSRFGFGSSRRYVLLHRSRSYDSKAIAGVAHGFQFPDAGPLRSGEFNGGQGGAATKLGSLGFEIHDQDPQRPDSAPSRGVPVHRDIDVDVPETAATLPPRVARDGQVVALVGCVKGKRRAPTRAADLYTSDLFTKRRDHVTRRGLNWFILSAQHGLVTPDQVLAPYDMALKDQSASYRCEWGRRVVTQLAARLGSLAGMTVEIHAGAAYVEALQAPLIAEQARITTPLKGLPQGRQLAWYLHYVPETRQPELEPAAHPLSVIGDGQLAQRSDEFPWGRTDLAQPGLYSWWVDEAGATDLSRGLGLAVEPGLIYIGQTGASRIGKASAATLRSRVSQHLNGGVKASTWRRTLAAVLIESGPVDEKMVSRWMREHLSLIVCPVAGPAGVLELERRALQRFDPPLNLDGMNRTGIRIALTALRSDLAARASRDPLRPVQG